MSTEHWTVNSKPELFKFLGQLKAHWEQYHYVRIKMTPGAKRSLDQNALVNVWYGDVAKQTGDIAPSVRRFCKLTYGIPILSRDPGHCRFYERYLHQMFDYEEKLNMMDYFAVTSIMTVPQLREYLDTMQKEFGAQGVILEVK